ncbi:hypothetical protein D3C85_833880 [compost metagenome]
MIDSVTSIRFTSCTTKYTSNYAYRTRKIMTDNSTTSTTTRSVLIVIIIFRISSISSIRLYSNSRITIIRNI